MPDSEPDDTDGPPSPLPSERKQPFGSLGPPTPLRQRNRGRSDASANSSRSNARSVSRSDVERESDDRVIGEQVDKRKFLVKQSSAYRLRVERGGVEDAGNNAWAGVRAQEVRVRDEDATQAMPATERYRRFLQRKLFPVREEEEEEEEAVDEGDEEEGPKKLQFNLTSKRVVEDKWKRPLYAIYKVACCGSASYVPTDISSGTDPNQLLINFMYFMFRTSFFVMVLISAAAFYTLVLIFAGLIVSAGKLDPTCVVIGGNNVFPGANGTRSSDAFSLSWTTFSTVGYGSYGVSTAGESPNAARCAYLTSILAIESFVGVLFAGFVGAILFGKVVRIQSRAQVVFSHPVVIRYGCGVSALDVDEEDDEEEEDEKEKSMLKDSHILGTVTEVSGAVEERAAIRLQAAFRGSSVRVGKKAKKIPCPALEFRVANTLHDEAGGEIMDAVLNVVATLDASEVEPSLRDKLDEARAHWVKSAASPRGNTTDSATSSGAELDGRASASRTVQFASGVGRRMSSVASSVPRSSVTLAKSAIEQVVGDYTRKDHQAVDEDPTSRLAPKRIFSKLLIEASEHPYFKRVWLARHIVDETSPLLTPKARRLVKKNYGYWPESLNNYQAVKNSIQFNQILVSLCGMSNISGSEVHAQKVYHSVDCVVGYQFVNVLYRPEDEGLKVDLDLLNDVREQNNGGGEPLFA